MVDDRRVVFDLPVAIHGRRELGERGFRCPGLGRFSLPCHQSYEVLILAEKLLKILDSDLFVPSLKFSLSGLVRHPVVRQNSGRLWNQ